MVHNWGPGHGYAANLTYTISPRLLNEFVLGKSWNSYRFYVDYPDQLAHSVVGNIPQWYPNEVTAHTKDEAADANLMPSIQFGRSPVNPALAAFNNQQYGNHNDTWDITD